MGNKRRVERVKQLLVNADIKKIKSYIRKHRLKINRIVENETSRTLLHLSCKHVRDDVMRYLLKKGADASIGDKNGDTALHIAARKAIAGEQYAFQDLVLPLMQKCPEALSVRNKSGDSARSLVQIYEESLKSFAEDDRHESDSCESDESSEERRWHEKLQDEVEHEYGAWASYEQDYYQDREEETYEDWVERIRGERRSKHWQGVPRVSGSGTTEQTQKEEEKKAREFQKKLEEDHERYQERMKRQMEERKRKGAVLKKTIYEQKWTDLFSEIKNGTTLTFSDIPWPDGISKSSDDVRAFLFCDFGQDETTLRKKYLRSQQVRWHPDKFLQKFGQNLLENDRESILEKVKNVSQLMNQISERMSE